MTMLKDKTSSFLYGGNAPYVEEQYELYLADAASVTESWRQYFDALRETPAVDGSNAADVAHAPVVDRFVNLAKHRAPEHVVAGADPNFARKQVAVQSLIAAYRLIGTRKARLDPLGWSPIAAVPELSPAYYGLKQSDMTTKFSTADSYFWEDDASLADIVAALEETYSGTLSSEVMHIGDAEQRRWWQMRLESSRAKPKLSGPKRLRVLERLTAAEGLEKYLHTRYVGQKRFSLEGGESLIVLLDELVHAGAIKGVKNVVMGMAHRGRLNVLVNITGKPPQALFDEFEGRADTSLLAGDVKYHKGYTGVTQTPAGPVEVLLAFNPSHLEIVNPVVQGIARAKSERDGLSADAVLPIEIHGDAAVIGQGIVMETMSLAYTRGHGTGGTVHVVVNNQVGFTTSDPRDARSSRYSTDIAKMIEAPILHVNGDDPDAVVMAAQLALDYRATFKRSVVIELVCFRRHGHQEQDTPNMTQPLMYKAIAAHPGTRALYAQRLMKDEVVTGEQAEMMVREYRAMLDKANADAAKAGAARAKLAPVQKSLTQAAALADVALPTEAHIRDLARRITTTPDGFKLHPLVSKVMEARREMALGHRPMDWGMGEHLAYASLLMDGNDVRLSGQDSERGTFGHRHAVLHNQQREQRSDGAYVPLQNLQAQQARFRVTNSILSEAAVMGFEYGYSITHPKALVLWEGQFGDFANGAQVVIDQFLSAGSAKWGQDSGLTLLLPHGQDGQGPEHASARLERYLQLSAQENMVVAQPTLPAQFFHLLRQQAYSAVRRPLIVMTPKSLLRHPEAVSSLQDFASSGFRPLIGEEGLQGPARKKVKTVVLCSGKIFYDLREQQRKQGRDDVALVRLEQLYPLPMAQLQQELGQYLGLRSIVWCQEEPQNQGAWTFIEPKIRAAYPAMPLRYAGPAEAASTAPGYAAVHVAQHAAVVHSAFN